MIKFENGMLVLSSIFTKEDVDAINKYVEFIRNDQNERIIKLLEETKLLTTIEQGVLVNYAENAIALIKGEK